MKANTTGLRTFKLCEQYDQKQLKAYASKPRAKLLKQLERLRAKVALAEEKQQAALADPNTARVNALSVKEVKAEINEINSRQQLGGESKTIDTRGKINGPELKQKLIAYYKSA